MYVTYSHIFYLFPHMFSGKNILLCNRFLILIFLIFHFCVSLLFVLLHHWDNKTKAFHFQRAGLPSFPSLCDSFLLFIFVTCHCFFFFPLPYVSVEGQCRALAFIRARRQPPASARQPKPPGCSHPWQQLNLPTVH